MSARMALITNLQVLLNQALQADGSLQSEAELAYHLQVVEHQFVSDVTRRVEELQTATNIPTTDETENCKG